jgi:hypothetical protein
VRYVPHLSRTLYRLFFHNVVAVFLENDTICVHGMYYVKSVINVYWGQIFLKGYISLHLKGIVVVKGK